MDGDRLAGAKPQMTPAWDLLIRGGTLVDPARSIAATRDIAFHGGKVAAVAETLVGDGTEVTSRMGSSPTRTARAIASRTTVSAGSCK